VTTDEAIRLVLDHAEGRGCTCPKDWREVAGELERLRTALARKRVCYDNVLKDWDAERVTRERAEDKARIAERVLEATTSLFPDVPQKPPTRACTPPPVVNLTDGVPSEDHVHALRTGEPPAPKPADPPLPEELAFSCYAPVPAIILLFMDGRTGAVTFDALGIPTDGLRLETLQEDDGAVAVETTAGETIHIDAAVLRARIDPAFAEVLRREIAAACSASESVDDPDPDKPGPSRAPGSKMGDYYAPCSEE
jgi:hypothetical protein